MKKLIALAAAAVCLISSTFALDIAVGARGLLGGNIGKDYSGFEGIVGGAGAYVNLDLIAGFGFQGEVNVVTNKIEVSVENASVTTTDYEIVDFPFLIWYNLKLPFIAVGAGVGLNFSTFNDENLNDNGSVGLAAGANVKIYISKHFGLVFGADAVFDFIPTVTVTVDGDKTTYTAVSRDYYRKTIYGNAGLEFRF
ncbi:MAG: hypothetical protein IJ688_03340 [Treponema sp.]|nr:hypothetical protein [Treponema sp.]